MQRNAKIVVSVTVLGLLLLLISPISAAFNGTNGPAAGAGDRGCSRISGLLQNLSEQGHDVSGISAAVESGDLGAAHTLLKQFMDEHRDAMPAPPPMGKRCQN